jgi:hypothetical protein
MMTADAARVMQARYVQKKDEELSEQASRVTQVAHQRVCNAASEGHDFCYVPVVEDDWLRDLVIRRYQALGYAYHHNPDSFKESIIRWNK